VTDSAPQRIPKSTELEPINPEPLAPALAWAMVFGGSLLAAALLAPWVHAGLIALLPEARWPPARVFNRLAMLAAAAQLYFWRRSLGWSALRELLSLGSPRHRLAEVLVGLAASLAAIAAAVAWALAFGDIGPTSNVYEFIARRTATAFVGALAASLIEESFFRGAMLSSLRRSHGWWTAVITTSALYASVHVLVSDRTLAWREFSIGAGLRYLQRSLFTLLEPASWPPLCGLFLGGLLLALVVRRTHSLWPAVGLHAGWAFSFQIAQHATRVLVDIQGTSHFAARNWLIGRPWAWAALAGSCGLAWVWVALRDRGSAAQAPSESPSTSLPGRYTWRR
jgi:membrane protease YdiL (CAAX protease family)